jgi:molybdenum cofactor cytidylyltransferase
MLPIGLILLAAGGSGRLGTPKQLLRDAESRSLLRRAAETALESACTPVAVVLGASAESTRLEIEDLPVIAVINADWATGIASSLRAGLSALTAVNDSLDAMIVMLCDQPLVSAALLDSLIAARQVSGHELVACEYGGILGVPALFGRILFNALAALDGDEGARKIIRGYQDPLTRIPFPGGLLDVDTPDNAAELRMLGSADG